MSSEEATVVKKRGRPRKVVTEAEPVTSETPESGKKTRGRKATRATDPAEETTGITKRRTAAKKDEATAQAAGVKRTRKPTAAQVATAEIISPPETPILDPATAQTTAASEAPIITPESSQILSQVRELAAKATAESEAMAADSNPLSYRPTAPLSSLTSSKAKQTSKPATTTAMPAKPSTSNTASVLEPSKASPAAAAAAPLQPPQRPPHPAAPTTTHNSTLKANPLSAPPSSTASPIPPPAGARPGRPRPLPPGYNAAARKVTMTIVALPIAIVTSYVLYERRESCHISLLSEIYLGLVADLFFSSGSWAGEEASCEPGLVEGGCGGSFSQVIGK